MSDAINAVQNIAVLANALTPTKIGVLFAQLGMYVVQLGVRHR